MGILYSTTCNHIHLTVWFFLHAEAPKAHEGLSGSDPGDPHLPEDDPFTLLAGHGFGVVNPVDLVSVRIQKGDQAAFVG